MINKNALLNFDSNIENQNLLHINRLPARATIVPAQKRGIYYRNKFDSTLIKSLDGDYKFKYLAEDTEKDFYLKSVDDTAWDIIDVPSMWQYRGYGKPEYPNIRYPFPFLPPYIKKQNPVGLYRKVFKIDNPAERTILHFAGVDNAFYVYLNGEMIGFSKGSRIPAEFDVSEKIVKGHNLLCVKVFTYSDASYLENQDMLLASGIFRNVFLIETKSNTLWDYRVTTTYSSITVNVKLKVNTPYRVRITLDGEVAESEASDTVIHTFTLNNPKLWNAETPNLYDLYIELLNDDGVFEAHSKRVGIMHTRIQGNKLLVNEKPIYVKGINRHENDPWNGRTMTVSQIEKDLKMIKANNLNAIRLAHYPNDPATYEIAAEIGLYLMDEADLESHGAYIANNDQGYLSKSPEWFPAYKDRVTRMLERDKNEVAVFLWSTGNEIGRGENNTKCYHLVREFDPTKECRLSGDQEAYCGIKMLGYYPMSTVEEVEDTHPVLCYEYGHAMGNSPGTLADYWDFNYNNEKMLGGFAWEFRSHGFGCRDKDGKVFMKYGGDFDDDYHWCNFNMDGYCLSDGRPKPSWYELGTVSFAAYTTFNNGIITVKNTNDFLTLSYLSGEYRIICDGVLVKKTSFHIPETAPHQSFSFTPDLNVENPVSGARYFLNVVYYQNGKKVHEKQFKLGVLVAALPHTAKASKPEISVKDYILSVKYDDFSCEFTKGMLSKVTSKNKVLLNAPMKLNIHRAYIDNDGIIGLFPRRIGEWQKFLIDKYYFNLFDIDVCENQNKTTVTVGGSYTANSLYSGFHVKIVYDIFSDKTVTVTVTGEPYGELPQVLPRLGVVFETDSKLNTVKWLGRGPLENYADSLANAPVGIYQKEITQLNTDYDLPQETGNHEETYALTLKDENGNNGLSVIGSDTFAFSYHDFSLENLTSAKHKN